MPRPTFTSKMQEAVMEYVNGNYSTLKEFVRNATKKQIITTVEHMRAQGMKTAAATVFNMLD